MQEENPNFTNWVIKLNNERYGRGIAYIEDNTIKHGCILTDSTVKFP